MRRESEERKERGERERREREREIVEKRAKTGKAISEHSGEAAYCQPVEIYALLQRPVCVIFLKPPLIAFPSGHKSRRDFFVSFIVLL